MLYAKLIIDSFAREGCDVFAHDGRCEEIGQTTCADAEETLFDVVFSQRFGHDGVEVDGFIYRLDAACCLKPSKTTSLLFIFLDGGAHHQRGFGSGCYCHFASGGFDEVCTGIHGEDGGFLDE